MLGHNDRCRLLVLANRVREDAEALMMALECLSDELVQVHTQDVDDSTRKLCSEFSDMLETWEGE